MKRDDENQESLDSMKKVMEFEMWAFGKIQSTSYDSSTMKAWNELHEDELRLFESGAKQEDIEKMFDLYLKEKGIDLRE